MTHPGVGALTALAYVLIIGDANRFSRGKQIGSYLGLVPTEESSAKVRFARGTARKSLWCAVNHRRNDWRASEPWLDTALVQLKRNRALHGVHAVVRSKKNLTP